LKAEFFRDEVIKTERLLSQLNRENLQRQSLFRFPYGTFNFATLRVLKELNLTPVMWSLLTADFDVSVSANMVLNLLCSAHGGDIVVMHDNEKSISNLKTVLPIALPQLAQRFHLNACRLWLSLMHS
jgi:Polysaccharide deacetylase.